MVLGVFLVLVGCARSPAMAPAQAPADAAEPPGNFYIDGAHVSEGAFGRILSTLSEEQTNWYCDGLQWIDEDGRTQVGGEEGWDTTDPTGRVFHVSYRVAGPDTRWEITRIRR